MGDVTKKNNMPDVSLNGLTNFQVRVVASSEFHRQNVLPDCTRFLKPFQCLSHAVGFFSFTDQCIVYICIVS